MVIMPDKALSEMTDAELVSEAGSRVIGTPSGLKSQEAQAEMMRRLIKALADSKESADRYNKVLFFLTVMMFMVAFAQLVLSSVTLTGFPEWARIVGTLMVVGAILGFGYWGFKEMGFDK